MDIAPVLVPGTAAPTTDPVAGAASAVPTAPGQAFSDLFAEALGEATLPATDPAIIGPAVAIVAMPVPETTATIEPVADVAQDVPTPNAEPVVKIAASSDPPPTAAVPEPPPPPDALIASWKEAPAEAPNAPAIKQDQPEEITAVSDETETDQPDQAPDLTAVETAAAVWVAAPVVAANAAPSPAPATKATKSEPELKVSAQVTAPAETADAPEIAEPVQVATVVPTDAKVSASAPQDAPKLEAAPDLGVVPVVTVTPATDAPVAAPIIAAVNPAVIAPTPTPVKDVAVKDAPATAVTESNVLAAAPAKPVETKAVDAKPATETKSAEKPQAAFSEVLIEEAVKGGKDATADTGDGTNGQPAADLTPTAPVAVRTAATEKPTEGANRPEIDRHLVVKQVADRIENLVASRPRDGVTVHLEPRDLGTVTLVVKGLASSLDVQVTASDERVRQGLEASRPDLAQALAPRGIELRDMRITTSATGDSQTGTGSRDAGSNQNPDGRPRQQQSSNSSQSGFTESSRRPSAAAATRSLRRSGGVDLLA